MSQPRSHLAAEKATPRQAPAMRQGGRLLLLAAAALCGFALGAAAFGPPAPFGQRLPATRSLIAYQGVSVADTSFLERRINDAWLPNLAPQDDGAPPLVWTYTSERADFTIAVPYGCESTSFTDAEFEADAVDMQAALRLDQPLRAIKVSMPGRKDKESIETYASRIRNELETEKAVFYPEQDPVSLPAYRFVRLEYHRVHDGADVAHCIFIGPLGRRVLVIDLMGEPKHRDLCRPYFDKIIRSFSPGWFCKRAMLMEDPAYGEYAGSGLLRESDPRTGR